MNECPYFLIPYSSFLISHLYKGSCGRVARLSSAKAATAVRIRSGPQKSLHLKALCCFMAVGSIAIFRNNY
jgi:hypothetical protein